MHANALAGATVAMETPISASPGKESVILSAKGKHDEGICMGGQDALCVYMQHS